MIEDRLAALYTPLDEAVAVLRSRRAASILSIDSALERHLSARPYAVLFRQVATPNFELERFVSLASSGGLTPLVVEFTADRFSSSNELKRALACLSFPDGPQSAVDSTVSALTIIRIAASNGIAFRDVATLWLQPLVEFHHELLFARSDLRAVELFEGSGWFSSHGKKALHYYAPLFSLFLDHAILFEDFLLTSSELKFTSDLVVPAFELVCSLQGRKPLICRIGSCDVAESPAWFHYPRDYAETVRMRLAQVRQSSAAKRRTELG